MIGSGLDHDVLEDAEVETADAFFALTRGDNTNLMAAQMVKLKFSIPRVCVKVADPLRANAYRKLGYFCITPSLLTSGMMRDWFNDAEFGPVDVYNALPKELVV